MTNGEVGFKRLSVVVVTGDPKSKPQCQVSASIFPNLEISLNLRVKVGQSPAVPRYWILGCGNQLLWAEQALHVPWRWCCGWSRAAANPGAARSKSPTRWVAWCWRHNSRSGEKWCLTNAFFFPFFLYIFFWISFGFFNCWSQKTLGRPHINWFGYQEGEGKKFFELAIKGALDKYGLVVPPAHVGDDARDGIGDPREKNDNNNNNNNNNTNNSNTKLWCLVCPFNLRVAVSKADLAARKPALAGWQRLHLIELDARSHQVQVPSLSASRWFRFSWDFECDTFLTEYIGIPFQMVQIHIVHKNYIQLLWVSWWSFTLEVPSSRSLRSFIFVAHTTMMVVRCCKILQDSTLSLVVRTTYCIYLPMRLHIYTYIYINLYIYIYIYLHWFTILMSVSMSLAGTTYGMAAGNSSQSSGACTTNQNWSRWW